jgi:hypothetical protein
MGISIRRRKSGTLRILLTLKVVCVKTSSYLNFGPPLCDMTLEFVKIGRYDTCFLGSPIRLPLNVAPPLPSSNNASQADEAHRNSNLLQLDITSRPSSFSLSGMCFRDHTVVDHELHSHSVKWWVGSGCKLDYLHVAQRSYVEGRRFEILTVDDIVTAGVSKTNYLGPTRGFDHLTILSLSFD